MKVKLTEADVVKAVVEPHASFGRLTVSTKSMHSDGKNTFWECYCDCGRWTRVTTTRLRSGHTSSCGCWRDESRLMRAAASRSEFKRERRIWYGMIQRCHDKSCWAFKWYGGRGIKVCPRWRRSFWLFVKDMGASRGLDLDRIDNDGGYNPKNCRWTDRRTNANNRSSNVRISHAGKTMTMAQWAIETGIKAATIQRRKEAGVEACKIFSKDYLDGTGRKLQISN